MSFEPNDPNGEVNEDGLIDNSTHWLGTDPETGAPDLSDVHSVHDYIGDDGTHYTLNEETGEYEVTIPGPNDD